VIEKHVVDDRSRRGADHQAALEPAELVRFVEMLRAIDVAEGPAGPSPFSEAEERYRRYSKKSLVAARALQAGQTVTPEDICARRFPEPGLPPDAEGRLLGRRTRRAIAAYERLLDEDVE
jgi:sialic acid synthase SpsE